ncbi:uncharacterized protein LOC135826841 [Sycon ciliatum]|uniref:uncharacterized protein LOC135826841 n=1 Tax=Sycon ciliatum TaxID=27933 RepID=UPI0031F61674
MASAGEGSEQESGSYGASEAAPSITIGRAKVSSDTPRVVSPAKLPGTTIRSDQPPETQLSPPRTSNPLAKLLHHVVLIINVYTSKFGDDGRALGVIAVGYGRDPDVSRKTVAGVDVELQSILSHAIAINIREFTGELLVRLYAEDILYTIRRPKDVSSVSDWDEVISDLDMKPITFPVKEDCVVQHSAVIYSKDRRVNTLSLGVSYSNKGIIQDFGEFTFLEQDGDA